MLNFGARDFSQKSFLYRVGQKNNFFGSTWPRPCTVACTTNHRSIYRVSLQEEIPSFQLMPSELNLKRFKGSFQLTEIFFKCENHDFLVNERSMLICTRFTAMTSPFSLKYRFSHILRVQNAFVIEIRDKIDCLVVILVQPLFTKMYSVSSNSLLLLPNPGALVSKQ